ncbi:ATP-binding SpoIIE family protein phosphatase [Streptomyces arenae]|uniref:ATP-binding SpoIIE family protein phosphatase n=1 Tax=Streptomyces arenae TaxID=29301 RepID=UPI002659664B|nr:SpoIIE family protein phosphatase [Streptomyces arenae]MCG7209036.1 SpoIIE family protein phosphatase [Streptomyces arenae]
MCPNRPEGAEPDPSPAARTRAEALALALRQATASVGGRGALLHRWDPGAGRLTLVAADGSAAGAARAWSELREEQDVPPACALRRGVLVRTAGDCLGTGAAGTVAVPLVGAGGPIGALSVLLSGPDGPDDVQRSFLHAVAAWAAGYLERPAGPPYPEYEPEHEKTVRAVELTAALAEAVTVQDVVRAVAEHVLAPFGAEGLIVSVFENGRLTRVGEVGYPLDYLKRFEGPLNAGLPVTDVLRSRKPLFLESPAQIYERYPAVVDRILMGTSPKMAWAFLPLVASGRAIGVSILSYSRPRTFDEADRALLTTLSALVGQALERARLYDLEHARAQELQSALLPRTLPRLPAAVAAARYLPAGRGEQVGGDWFDVIPLSADRVAMVIGDVMGHGIAEAATMGRLRTAVRTLADLDMAPDELLGHLNDLVSDLGEDFYATCLYAVYDPVGRSCRYSLAGHPPPVFVYPDGTVHSPVVSPDPPLGAATPPFAAHELPLPDGSLVVLCTDGLIESAAQDVEQGLTELLRVLSAAGPARLTGTDPEEDVRVLEKLCDTVVSALVPDREHTTDDAALLIAHTHAMAPDDVASFRLPDDPRAAGQARELVRDQLTHWGLDDLSTTTELLVSELVGNVIRHAKGPLRLRLLRSRILTCEVYDGSLSTPRIRHATYNDEGGRGLQLVAALSRRWGARYLSDTKCIWTEQDIPNGSGDRTSPHWSRPPEPASSMLQS